jgi:hypothetical protein
VTANAALSTMTSNIVNDGTASARSTRRGSIVQRVEVAREHAECRSGTGRHCEARDFAQERRAAKGAGARPEREERGGYADRQARSERQVAWEEGYAIGVRPTDRIRTEAKTDLLTKSFATL